MTHEEKVTFVRTTVLELAHQLEGRTPLWGAMTPQHIVEHLVGTIRCSNGRFNVPLKIAEDKLPRYYEFMMSDKPFKPGAISPAIGADLPELRNASLQEALDKLDAATNRFFEYHAANPDIKPMHPVFGPLSFHDWIHFHWKHGRHHFMQYGLLPLLDHPYFEEISAQS